MLFQLGHDHRAAQNPINIVTNITSHKNGHINPIKNNTNEIKKQEITSLHHVYEKYYDVLRIMSSFKRYFYHVI